MSRTVNQVILLGYLGKDPTVRYTPGGTIIAEMSLATSERTKQGGDWVDRTEWHQLKAFNRTAEVCRDYLRKGSQVYLEGRLQTSSWLDKEQRRHYKTEILVNELIMLDQKTTEPPSSDRTQKPAPSIWKEGAYEESPAQEQPVDPSGVEIDDDDIPF
jgi:single-strand DNA-binding protein